MLDLGTRGPTPVFDTVHDPPCQGAPQLIASGAAKLIGVPSLAFCPVHEAEIPLPAPLSHRPEQARSDGLLGMQAVSDLGISSGIGLVENAGTGQVLIDRTYPLEQAGAAVAHMASRRARGKVVIQVGDLEAG